MTTLDEIRIELHAHDWYPDTMTVYIDVWDNHLSRRWLAALNQCLRRGLHLEKNYCFLGWPDSDRHGWYILQQINASIDAINRSSLDYRISDRFEMSDLLDDDARPRSLRQSRMNDLHRYFEDLQGHAGAMSLHWQQADPAVRWHIRQLNLLCHEFESWALSYRKQLEAPEWVRPSQLMCWLNSPRFELEPQDLELFGVDTIARPQGGVYVGVNKAVGKHHWEVFHDEGRDSRISELFTSALRPQTMASADFDIEWGQDTRNQPWMQQELNDFRAWLQANGFDPEDPALTIGHPQVAQVNLLRSFKTNDATQVIRQLGHYQDVISIHTSTASAWYDYHWSDIGYAEQQQRILSGKTS